MKGLLDAAIGIQWGDEGKGRVVNYLLNRGCFDKRRTFRGPYLHCVKNQGGNNAGNTTMALNLITGLIQAFALHLLPPGIFFSRIKNYLSPGMAINLAALAEEIRAVEAMGYSCRGRLFIAAQAPIVLPIYQALDALVEKGGKHAIGTTKRGIGPTYEDFAGRRSISVYEAVELSADELTDKVANILKMHNPTLAAFDEPTFTVEETMEYLRTHRELLGKHLLVGFANTLSRVLAAGENIFGFIAHGHHLDPIHGTRPFNTSPICTVGGLLAYSGIPAQDLHRVYGITKSYTTRVGLGPFPTELMGDEGEKLRALGSEIGVSTGRKRRCGWLDLPMLRAACRLSGVTDLCLTKLDILARYDQPITVNDTYLFNGQETDEYTAELCAKYVPTNRLKFKPFGTTHSREARRYLDLIEERVRPISLVSTGTGKEDMFVHD
jgi:adenylosuccinate synthase